MDCVCDSDMGWLRGRDWGHPQAQLTLFMDHVFWVLHSNGMPTTVVTVTLSLLALFGKLFLNYRHHTVHGLCLSPKNGWSNSSGDSMFGNLCMLCHW